MHCFPLEKSVWNILEGKWGNTRLRGVPFVRHRWGVGFGYSQQRQRRKSQRECQQVNIVLPPLLQRLEQINFGGWRFCTRGLHVADKTLKTPPQPSKHYATIPTYYVCIVSTIEIFENKTSMNSVKFNKVELFWEQFKKKSLDTYISKTVCAREMKTSHYSSSNDSQLFIYFHVDQ